MGQGGIIRYNLGERVVSKSVYACIAVLVIFLTGCGRAPETDCKAVAEFGYAWKYSATQKVGDPEVAMPAVPPRHEKELALHLVTTLNLADYSVIYARCRKIETGRAGNWQAR